MDICFKKTRLAMLALERKLFTLIFLLKLLHEVVSTGNAPEYLIPSSPRTETVSEDADPSTDIFTVVVVDDEGDTLTHSYYSQTPSSPSFNFDTTSRKLYPPANLDAETTTSFAIEFSVTDGTSTTNSPVLTINILDVNEYSPIFNQTSYTSSLYDTASNGDVVLTVFASDLDVFASLTYSITVGDSTTFSIDPSSGIITVATAVNLNAASTTSYTLTVQVSDTSTTDTATVVITLLDDPCFPNPCENSGSCSKSGISYTCTCQTGWIGTTCSTDDPCLPNPCENSGNCSVSGTSYQCQCTSDYSGLNCTEEIEADDPCLPNPCENSGNCTLSGTSYQCQCTSDYSGLNCTEDIEIGKDSPDDNGLSGGILVAIILAPCIIVIAATIVTVILVKKYCVKKEREKPVYFDGDLVKYKQNSVSPTNEKYCQNQTIKQ